MNTDEVLRKLQSGEMVLVKRETAQKMGLHPEDRQVATPCELLYPAPLPDGTLREIKEMNEKLLRDMQAVSGIPDCYFGRLPRHTAAYKEAVQRVKLSYLTENLGLDIKGIIHVGSNDGYEMQWYRKMGIQHLMGIEPLPAACERFTQSYPTIPLGRFALGDQENVYKTLYIAPGDGQGSSFLREIGKPHSEPVATVPVHRWDSLIGIHHELYDCLVMDVQGFELPALMGFGTKLAFIQCINIELSKEPIYEGGAPAAEVIEFLDKAGFVQMSRTEEHNDVFFIRKGTPLKNLKINLGSGQRPFSERFINVDIEDRWHPHVVADGANMPMFPDESAKLIVLSHTLEHYGCNEGNGMLAECYRILQPGGSLIVSVPELKALADGWRKGRINDETYIINIYGAYMGSEADRHKFGFTPQTLSKTLESIGQWSDLRVFNYREIPGMDLARDWWILSMEAIK